MALSLLHFLGPASQYFRIGHMGISVMEDEREHIDKVRRAVHRHMAPNSSQALGSLPPDILPYSFLTECW